MLELERPSEALLYTQLAVDNLRTVLPVAFVPLEVRFLHGRALHAIGDARAAGDMTALAAELHDIAQSHVPLEFRSSFLQANSVHRELVRIQRHGIASLGQRAMPRLLRP